MDWRTLALTAVGFAAGAILNHFFARVAETSKQRKTLQATTYADFLRAVAMVANPQEAEKGRALLADAKARISVYGGPKTLEALASYYLNCGKGGLHLRENAEAFVALCQAMRHETGGRSGEADHLCLILFDALPAQLPPRTSETKPPTLRE